MAIKTDFNISPYFDDYLESKRFHRVLFRPGFAVQARELTQIQSILQNQIKRLGDHLFKDGAQIIWAGNGLILSKHRYSKGMLHGEYIDYYKSGQKSIVGNYRFGKKHGTWTYSYKDGVVALSGNYRNGDPKGSWFWIRANKSEMVNVDDPDKDWVTKRIREWERIYN